MQTYQFHPLADMFPLMEGEEFDSLVADIKANGQREPITLYQGKILDGRNRYRACLAAGMAPRLCGHKDDCAYIGNPVAYVISKNIHRRHLTAENKRDLIAELLKAQPGKSNRQIAKSVKADDKTVGAVRAELEATAEIPQLEKTIGADGKMRARPAKEWTRERHKQHRAKRNKLKQERNVGQRKQREKKRLEDHFELAEAEAKHFATKLIALDRDLAQELRLLLSVGAELELMDAIGEGLGLSFLEETADAPEDSAEAMKATLAEMNDGLDIPECLRRKAVP